MKSGGTPYCVYKYRTALIGAATSATVTGSRTKSLCSIQETSRAPNQEAAILASKSHIMPPFLLSRTTSAQSASLRGWLWKEPHHIHYNPHWKNTCPISYFSQFKFQVSCGCIWNGSSIKLGHHQLKTNWRNLCFSFLLFREKGSHTRRKLKYLFWAKPPLLH